jgi:hypothetical protein
MGGLHHVSIVLSDISLNSGEFFQSMFFSVREKTILEILSINTANSSTSVLPVGFFTTDGQKNFP